jgi:hypothetical protein
MKNIRKDLIQEYSIINAHKMEELMKEDKIVKMTVWSITKVDERNPTKEETDEQIQAILKDYANVFSNTL